MGRLPAIVSSIEEVDVASSMLDNTGSGIIYRSARKSVIACTSGRFYQYFCRQNLHNHGRRLSRKTYGQIRSAGSANCGMWMCIKALTVHYRYFAGKACLPILHGRVVSPCCWHLICPVKHASAEGVTTLLAQMTPFMERCPGR